MLNLSLLAKGSICLLSIGTIGSVAGLASSGNLFNSSEIVEVQQQNPEDLGAGRLENDPKTDNLTPDQQEGKESSLDSSQPSDPLKTDDSQSPSSDIQTNSKIEPRKREPAISIQMVYGQGPFPCLRKFVDGVINSVTCGNPPQISSDSSN
ncbi:hypothetical protein [Mycoplasma suis]|uniref:Uncharacterized protein n=1 Tax=Mycoplasma suis (strain Illinois) TaxID=768700 RepID=F0QS14_MYCSL|nr:hypothetical protein [Mycoplasma suis]ADX98284.1 hypothetical protein MSU_0759 [Mycoplasma suis str. Illinois]